MRMSATISLIIPIATESNLACNFSYVFLGVAHNGLEQYEDAENDYKKAIEINQDQLLAWQGLVNLFEKREKWSDLAETLNKLNEIYAASNDGNRLLDNISKLCDIYRSKESDESKVRL
jgi:superkiller protein 3